MRKLITASLLLFVLILSPGIAQADSISDLIERLRQTLNKSSEEDNKRINEMYQQSTQRWNNLQDSLQQERIKNDQQACEARIASNALRGWSGGCDTAPSNSITPFTNVDSYFRNDGTFVNQYNRTVPDSTLLNNWSTKGNTNPFTGQKGTITSRANSRRLLRMRR
ncbi:MAG: hypothetical protein Q7S29_02970 [Candidatus Peribacter sp.]|nr:hypothetical protein [Candidatus Peribacter sp.]